MNETGRKTYKEKLRPTPGQAQALEEVLWRCRVLYNVALEQRITAYQRCRISLSRFDQEAELKALRAEFPEYEVGRTSACSTTGFSSRQTVGWRGSCDRP